MPRGAQTKIYTRDQKNKRYPVVIRQGDSVGSLIARIRDEGTFLGGAIPLRIKASPKKFHPEAQDIAQLQSACEVVPRLTVNIDGSTKICTEDSRHVKDLYYGEVCVVPAGQRILSCLAQHAACLPKLHTWQTTVDLHTRDEEEGSGAMQVDIRAQASAEADAETEDKACTKAAADASEAAAEEEEPAQEPAREPPFQEPEPDQEQAATEQQAAEAAAEQAAAADAGGNALVDLPTACYLTPSCTLDLPTNVPSANILGAALDMLNLNYEPNQLRTILNVTPMRTSAPTTAKYYRLALADHTVARRYLYARINGHQVRLAHKLSSIDTHGAYIS